MRIRSLIISLAVIGCNSNQQDTKQSRVEKEADKCFLYPRMIDSLQVQDLYDSARWYVYAWHCDELYMPKNDTSNSITFGELPLSFDNFIIRNDTLELNFNFMDGRQSILPSMTRDNKELSTGVVFDIKVRKKIYMLSPNGFSTTIKSETNRFENPLHPEVLAYIKDKWDKLDICFKSLVKQRGINE